MMESLILLVKNFYSNHFISDCYGNLGEKLFDTVEDVVADGLITLFMEKNNADKYLQSQRSSLVTLHNHLGATKSQQQCSDNGVGGSNLATISEQDATCDDEQVKTSLPVANGFGVDPTMTLIPHSVPIGDPIKSPDDESVVSDSQVYILICYCHITLSTLQTPSLLVNQSILDDGTIFFNYKKPHKFKVTKFYELFYSSLTSQPGAQLHWSSVV